MPNSCKLRDFAIEDRFKFRPAALFVEAAACDRLVELETIGLANTKPGESNCPSNIAQMPAIILCIYLPGIFPGRPPERPTTKGMQFKLLPEDPVEEPKSNLMLPCSPV
jgi:hypothetical protein